MLQNCFANSCCSEQAALGNTSCSNADASSVHNFQEQTAAISSAPPQQPASAPSAQPGRPDMRTCLESGPLSFPLPDDAETFSVPGVGLQAAFWTCCIDLHGPVVAQYAWA